MTLGDALIINFDQPLLSYGRNIKLKVNDSILVSAKITGQL